MDVTIVDQYDWNKIDVEPPDNKISPLVFICRWHNGRVFSKITRPRALPGYDEIIDSIEIDNAERIKRLPIY